LETVVANADKCLEFLDEDRPDIALFREPLKQIASAGRQGLDAIARTKPPTK